MPAPRNAYRIRTVSRTAIAGRDWIYAREPNGDMTFLVADDADCELSREAICDLLDSLVSDAMAAVF